MVVCTVLCVFVVAFTAGSSVEVQRPRGVSLTNHHIYDGSKPFMCLDRSKTISFDRVNDDYCDCGDGSDEPGTSACPNGKFHCTNTGYRPTYLPASRVNDGICDCCDGTDEYNSGTICENTCKELGKKEREHLRKMAEVSREGLRIKEQLVQEAKKSKEGKKKKLDELQELKTSLHMEVELLKTTKETAETLEKEAKEKHMKAWEELKEVKRKEKDNARAAAVFAELDKDADDLVSLSEIISHSELDQDGDGIFSETEAQAVLGGSSRVDFTAFQDVLWVNIREKYKSEIIEDDLPIESKHEVDGGVQSKELKVETSLEEDDHSYDKDDDDDEEDDRDDGDRDDEEEEEDYEDSVKAPVGKPGTSSSAKDEEQMPDYDEETQAVVNDAEDARDKFKMAEKNLGETEADIRNLEKELSLDLGPNDEFAYMYGNCYELTNEYIYRFCPFDRVTQKPKQGGIDTNLGTWDSWAGPEGNKYSLMKYEGGTSCWQGPNRSTKIKLVCGKETMLTSCTEPSRCEYLMELQTPALCEEPDNVPAEHDEL